MTRPAHRPISRPHGRLARVAFALLAAGGLYFLVWFGWNLAAPDLLGAPEMSGRSALGATMLVLVAGFVFGHGRRGRHREAVEAS